MGWVFLRNVNPVRRCYRSLALPEAPAGPGLAPAGRRPAAYTLLAARPAPRYEVDLTAGTCGIFTDRVARRAEVAPRLGRDRSRGEERAVLVRMQDRLLLEARWRDPEATPYEILGVEPGASAGAIHHAYLTLASCCHPDRYSDRPHLRAQAELVMKRVNVAYLELSRRPRTRYSKVTAEPPRLDPWKPGFLSTKAGKLAVVAVIVVSNILVAVLVASVLVFLIE